jgi:hypothetical protein
VEFVGKKSLIVYSVALASFLAMVILFFGGFTPYINRPNSDSIAGKLSSVSIDEDNLLIFSIRLNEASSLLNRKIKEANLNLPPVELFDSDLSYKSPGRSWIVVSNDLILIILYRDVLSSLDPDEIQGVVLHELGHVALGHLISPLSAEQRDTQMEKDADNFAVDSGINPDVLISAINKLAPESDEKSQRIASLVNIQGDSSQTP